MKPCCRDTVTILSAAAAVCGSHSAKKILSFLPRTQAPCDACKRVASEFDQRNALQPGIHEAHPREVLDAIGYAIAYVLEGAV